MSTMQDRAAEDVFGVLVVSQQERLTDLNVVAHAAAGNVLTVVADVDVAGIAGVLAAHTFIERPAEKFFWLPACSCGWVAPAWLIFDRAEHQAEQIAAYIRGEVQP